MCHLQSSSDMLPNAAFIPPYAEFKYHS